MHVAAYIDRHIDRYYMGMHYNGNMLHVMY